TPPAIAACAEPGCPAPSPDTARHSPPAAARAFSPCRQGFGGIFTGWKIPREFFLQPCKDAASRPEGRGRLLVGAPSGCTREDQTRPHSEQGCTMKRTLLTLLATVAMSAGAI